MTDMQSTDQDALQALKRAEGHLSEAEDALWTLASNDESDEIVGPAEELTQELWELQHRVQDLQRGQQP